MKEKIIAFFESEKVKKLSKRIFSKKTFIVTSVVLAIAIALRITFSLIFEINGTVTKVDGSKITVSNFLTTQTVDVGDYPISSTSIQPGDRIEILKNISGQVYAIREGNKGHMKEMGKGKLRGNNNKGFKGKGSEGIGGNNNQNFKQSN
jgi:hypothetical protein